jgi:hypothetical protein
MESGISQKATRKNAIIVSVYRPFAVTHICYPSWLTHKPKVAKEVYSPSLPLGETGG